MGQWSPCVEAVRSCGGLPALVVACVSARTGRLEPGRTVRWSGLLPAFVAACVSAACVSMTNLAFAEEPSPDSDASGAATRSLAATDSLRVHFSDGRPPVKIPIVEDEGERYLGLDDLGRITGNGFFWDPESYRATLRVDSTRVGFVLGTPLVSVGTKIFQLSEPMGYLGGRLFLPFSVLEDVLCPIYGDRCTYEAKTQQLRIGGERPWLNDIDVEGGNRRLRLRLEPAPRGAHRLRWDPAGRLTVQVQGLSVGPERFIPEIRVSGVEGALIRSTATGLDLELDLSGRWVGARARETEEGLVVELTKVLEDVQQKGYGLLTSYLPTAVVSKSWGTRIILEVSEPRSGSRYLQELASEIATVLEDEYRYQVVFIPDRKDEGRSRGPKGLPELPSVPTADCWIGLRLEDYDSEAARDFLLVYTGNAGRSEDMSESVSRPGTPLASTGGEQVLAPPPLEGRATGGAERMVPWGQTSRVYAESSARLADELAERLNEDLKFRPVRTLARPARIFRGLSMPAVLIYPAVRADRKGLRALSDREQVELVAQSLADGIREFLRTRGRQ